MTLRRASPWILAIVLLTGWWVGAQQDAPAGPSNLARVLEEALEAQVEALNAEDPDRVMALFHPGARGREEAQRSLVAMFRGGDLRYTLDRYTFVALDEPYAYARALQTTRGAGPEPRRSEQLFVFRRHGGNWCFWTSVVLDTPEVSASGPRSR